jgi:hypothetical protein
MIILLLLGCHKAHSCDSLSVEFTISESENSKHRALLQVHVTILTTMAHMHITLVSQYLLHNHK